MSASGLSLFLAGDSRSSVQQKQVLQAAQRSGVGPTRVTRLRAWATPFNDLGGIQSGSSTWHSWPCLRNEHPLNLFQFQFVDFAVL